MDRFFPYEDSYNYYGDESCHLLNDNNRYMALGALCCPKRMSKQLSSEIRELKIKHGLNANYEIKSTKVSSGASDFYISLINWFLNCNHLVFRVVLIDKNLLNFADVKEYNLFYYKMYYILFRYYMIGCNNYIYLDYKDSQGGRRCAEIEDIVHHDHITNMKNITVQQINSRESAIIQLSDLLVGLTCYNACGKDGNQTKLHLISILKQILHSDLFTTTDASATLQKFNILNWRPKKNGFRM